MRRRSAIGLAVFLAGVPILARAESNTVTKVTARAEGGKTVVTVHGSATPSFTAYRLERPSRVVVDLADGRVSNADGPIDVDTWAVSQIATAQYADESTRTARVMIGFKRPASYDVRAKGHDVIITVTPDEAPPAAFRPESKDDGQVKKAIELSEAHKKAADASEERRKKAEAAVKQAERDQLELAAKTDVLRSQARALEGQREKALREAQADESRRVQAQGEARKLESEAIRQVEAAKREAEEARARAQAAQAELERVVKARKEEQARLSSVQAAGKQTSEEMSKVSAEMSKLREIREREQKRVEALKIEADQLVKLRNEEAKKLTEAQAQARRVANERAARLDEARLAAERRVQAAEATRLAEERRMQAQAEEATRLAQAAEASRKLRATESAVQAAEQKAKAAADAARVELQRVEKLRAESRRLGEEAQAARTDANRQRVESQRLLAMQQVERERLEHDRVEARRLADKRNEDARRAAHAVALASQSSSKMEAVEKEARRIAEERARDVARLEQARTEAQYIAQKRAEELKRLDEARAEARKLAAEREADLKALVQKRKDEEARLSAAQAAVESQVQKRKAEEARLMAAEAALQAQALKRKAEEARLTAAEAALLKQAQKREAEEARLTAAEMALSAQAQKLTAAETALQAQAQKRKAEEARLTATEAAVLKQAQKREAEEARLTAAQAALEAQVRDQSKLRSESASLEQKVAAARTELSRIEAQRQRLAVVPVKVAAEPAAKPAPAIPPLKMLPPMARPEGKLPAMPVVHKAPARVHDVRFSDEGDAARVIVDLGAEAEYTVLRADPKMAVLRIAGAELPKKLERTLDVAAYHGPVKRISSYVDPQDPGAVRVVVNFEGGGAEPKVVREGTQIAWEFAKATGEAAPKVTRSVRNADAASYPPLRVGAFGASLPLQVASAPSTNLATQGGRRRHVYTGRRISLDFKDIDIHNVLRLLADVGQVNIVTSDDTKGAVTIRMVDVPWDQALDVILKAKGLGMQREGNLIRVAPAQVLEKEIEAEIARAKAQVELKPIDTRLIPLSYADADKLLPRIQDVMSPRGKVSVDSRTNMLIISDVASNIALAEDLVRNLDTQTPQVLIEARIVEARTTFLRTIGIQWGGNSINSSATGNPTGIAFPSTVGVAGGAVDAITNTNGLQGNAASPNYVVNLPAPVGTGAGGALGLTLGSVNGAVNINLRLSSLENTGDVRIISAPKITTMDNVEAQIEQGVAIPISVVSAAGTNTVFVDAKLNLTVKPHVTNEGSVIMNVHITRNEPDFVNTGARGDPTILKKQARTEMLVRDGDTAVIGGIYTRNTGLAYNKIPWFAEIPVLGWLFKNRRENDDRTELLIFITPRIVNRAATMVRR